MAYPEGDPAAKAAQNHQPEPEDPHHGASRRRIIGDTEGPSKGKPGALTIGTAERMQDWETGSQHRRQSRTDTGGGATRATASAARRPAGKQRGNLLQASGKRRRGYTDFRETWSPSHRYSPWTGATGQPVEPSPARLSAAARGNLQQRCKPSRKPQPNRGNPEGKQRKG